MKYNKKNVNRLATSSLLCALLLGGAVSAHAAGLGDALRDKMSGGSTTESSGSGSMLSGALGGGDSSSAALSAMGLSGSGTASNAAGVITYCMKNNYLNADKAAAVKDQLLGKVGLGPKEEPKDEGFLSGATGMITGKDGKSFSLDKVKGSIKEKACDLVLDNAKSLL
ncbi:DUF2501 domain-containing protein [Diaphorobacter sp. HDW4A]|uniref:DUF2501 domain-containing protein n=1 Tax=Diaphorobacter sp. HDW4A TaxID=2714924 RepID=UPI0014086A42|nr:DUF2501 domain-containing protein [Diaphorobacter sp. HDW4A]QIL81914.1 DUF2501 domain-containing protein [Diaphorobacter sp. HDW4A]